MVSERSHIRKTSVNLVRDMSNVLLHKREYWLCMVLLQYRAWMLLGRHGHGHSLHVHLIGLLLFYVPQ